MSSHLTHSALRIVAQLAVIVLFVLSANAQTVDESASDTTRTGTIAGRVLSDTGAPIPDAGIMLRTVGGALPIQMRRTLTDRDGSFRIDGLERGLYFVFPTAASYTQYREPNSQATYYRLGDNVTFTMIRGGVITGAVTSSSGEPVVGISVRALMVRDATGETPGGFSFSERTTDDRGIYRIYGLAPGTYVVVAGRTSYSNFPNAYDNQSPTYAPSGPRETATEIEVRPGVENNGVDIRYRGEPGRTVSGTIVRLQTQMQFVGNNVNLRRIRNGFAEPYGFAFGSSTHGFAFHGVPDGEYELDTQVTVSPTQMAVSDTVRITVKGADISGIVLAPKLLSSISGKVELETSTAPECANKRRPQFEELSVTFLKQREESAVKGSAPAFTSAVGTPDKSGQFVARNASSGRYTINTRFFARYWFLRRVVIPAVNAARNAAPATDLARNGLAVRSGEQIDNVVVTLTEGAGSVRGAALLPEGHTVQLRTTVFLVPAERDAAENPLRYYASTLESDGKFQLTNLSPGNYWAITRSGSPGDSFNMRTFRDPNQSAVRLQLRREAEGLKSSVELKPCQNIVDYKLPLNAR